jgi:hypothetical protein
MLKNITKITKISWLNWNTMIKTNLIGTIYSANIYIIPRCCEEMNGLYAIFDNILIINIKYSIKSYILMEIIKQ